MKTTVPKDWKKAAAHYFPSVNTIKIKAKSTDFYPQYLKYLFTYLNVPLNAKIIFTDKTIPGGIEEWLNQQKLN